ncbi:DNA polymerase III subunit delta [Psychroflexus planctonicus]|uniref:DNA polymerase III subunit delta n=1 Tax=Psychroflexus planctonicus TaxID=1526575 RepID=A0ABQ1SH02_9FLAO|nr:DNA polymerase III subunit delta [Psychroflexus planctonicus]GGE29912.1 DNA polymerase III subunit delta [Psychroflexus planctonicus]
MKAAQKILSDLAQKKYAPIYFLIGEKETFFVDQIADYIENNVLNDEEKGFNQQILYGKDVTMDDVVGAAKRFPMMAEHQVIIVREAQALLRSLDALESYAKQPQPSTILVFCCKYKKPDARKAAVKQIKKTGVYYQTANIYENQVLEWIPDFLAKKQYSIDTKASKMLVDFIGADLSKLNKELEKLMQILPLGSRITPDAVEENIGISKDFNNFELINAIVHRDEVKAQQIADYFTQNAKNNPLILSIYQLFNFFNKLMIYHSLSDKSNPNVSRELGVPNFFIKDYVKAAKFYPMKKVSLILAHLKELDLKSKGVDTGKFSNEGLLKEFLVKTMR